MKNEDLNYPGVENTKHYQRTSWCQQSRGPAALDDTLAEHPQRAFMQTAVFVETLK